MSLQDDDNKVKKFFHNPYVRIGLYSVCFCVVAAVYHQYFSSQAQKEEVKVTPIANRTHVCIYDNKRSKLMTDFIAVGKVQPKDGGIYFEEDVTKNMIGISGALIVTTNAIECPVLNDEEYP